MIFTFRVWTVTEKTKTIYEKTLGSTTYTFGGNSRTVRSVSITCNRKSVFAEKGKNVVVTRRAQNLKKSHFPMRRPPAQHDRDFHADGSPGSNIQTKRNVYAQCNERKIVSAAERGRVRVSRR